jgi:hypothetical protein
MKHAKKCGHGNLQTRNNFSALIHPHKLFALILLVCPFTGMAQKHQQLWFDYQIDYPFANQYLFEVTTSYQTVLTDSAKWRSTSISPVFEYQYINRLDLLGGLPFYYTNQTSTYDSYEIDPYIGARFHISQNKRIDSRLIFKLEERFFQNLETHSWEESNRMRLKAEAWVSINKQNLYQDKLWYAILDYEEFIVVDEQVNERFANRLRARLGIGYRLNYRNRFELIYTLQSSRNEIYGDLISNDNVLQLRYKMFLNPAKTINSRDSESN